MRRLATLALALAALIPGLAALAPGLPPGISPSQAEGAVTVQVTDSGDGDGVCPDATGCTLRAAITYVNAAGGDAYVIRFSGAAFPLGGSTIELLAPLPAVTASAVRIDTFGIPVRLSGAGIGDEGVDGLVLAGAGDAVKGLELTSFSGSCLVLAGAGATAGGPAAAEPVIAGDCETGIQATGEGARILGARIGFSRDGSPNPVATGIAIAASNAAVGPDSGPPSGGTVIGNAAAGIVIGGAGGAVEGVSVRGVRIGADAGGGPAPVETGIAISPPAAAITIEENLIAGTSVAGVSLGPDEDGASATGVVIRNNTFRAADGLPIDLGANGVVEPNDAGDADTGPNGLQNHPYLTRPTATSISGIVQGCAGCTVEIYAARHEPGATIERDLVPAGLPAVLTGPDGTFTLAVDMEPGTWIAAIATGPGGSSEFGPSARVGAGSVSCGSAFLVRGWNHAPYLGQPVSLGEIFPTTGDPGAVEAIYELVDGTGTYRRWFPGGGPANTLTELVPGSTYWFYASRPVALAGGFTFSSPIPIALWPGWNDFIYLGATADVRDVLRDLAGLHGGPYRYEAGDPGSWEWGGDEGTAPWARDFAELTACRAYHIRLDGAATLVPPQP